MAVARSRTVLVAAVTLAAALLLALASGASAAWLRVNKPTPVCFAEEVAAEDDTITVQYSLRAGESTSLLSVVRMTVMSPQTKSIVYDRELSDKTHVVTLNVRRMTTANGAVIASEIGEYEVCFHNHLAEGMRVFAQQGEMSGPMIEVLIDHGQRRRPLESAREQPAEALRHKVAGGDEVFVFTDEDGNVKEALRTHDYLDRVQHHIDSIEKAIDEALDEAKYFTQRQFEMRATSESSFTRVWLFSAVSIGTVVAVSLTQFLSLRSFLKHKKIV
jgi:hypothetical protein